MHQILEKNEEKKTSRCMTSFPKKIVFQINEPTTIFLIPSNYFLAIFAKRNKCIVVEFR